MTGTDLSASIEDVRESAEAVLDELKVVCGAGKLVDVSQHVIMASELGQTSDKDRHYAPMYKLSAYAHLGSTSGQRARSQGTRGHGTHRTAAGPWRVRTWMSWAMRVCRTLSVCNSVMSAGIMPFLATTSCVPRVVRLQLTRPLLLPTKAHPFDGFCACHDSHPNGNERRDFISHPNGIQHRGQRRIDHDHSDSHPNVTQHHSFSLTYRRAGAIP